MITVTGLVKKYGDHTVLKDINLNILEHKISFLMGKNGAGKTTLLKCMMTLEEHEGEVLFDDVPLKKIRDQVFTVFDDCPLYSNLSGYQNLELLSKKKNSPAKVQETALQFLNNDILHARVNTYSYGQKKKLSLILAILANPTYLFMDEVSNGLDFESMELLRDYVNERSRQGSVFLTGHQFEFYEQLIEDLFVLKDAEIIHVKDYQETGGNLGELYKKYFRQPD